MSIHYPRRVCGWGAVCLCLVLAVFSSALAATQKGTPLAWGSNSLEQTNVPPDLTNVIAVAAGHYHNLALKADGRVAGWGNPSSSAASPPASLTNAVAISAGYRHSLALRKNGRVVAWGANSSGQTNIPTGLTGVKAISAGQYHNLALRSNGTVVAWGSNTGGATNVPPGLVNVVAVAAGGNHSLALKGDGSVEGWGQNTYGQADTGGLNSIIAIAAGHDFSLALRSDGIVLAWGNPAQDRTSPPGDLNSVTKIAAGVAHGLALKSDGSVVAWGDDSSGQSTVPSTLRKVIGIGGGFSHSVVLRVEPPTIITQPQSQSVPVGTDVTFNIGIEGSAPVSYRWRKNGANISGATNQTFSIDNAQTNNAGNYTVVVTNFAGSVTSMVATLAVNAKPVIIDQPQSVTMGLGRSVNFSVSASGTPQLRYRWRHEGTNLPGATNSTLLITNLQHVHAGNYAVVVTNNYGSVTSVTAVLTVKDPPLITSHPQSQTVLANSPVSFSVVGTNIDAYQWLKNGSAINGATNSVFSIPNVQSNHAGSYSVTVTNPWGSNVSQTAVLTVVSRGTGVGEVVGWGESNIWNGFAYVDLTPPALTNVIAISAGAQHSMVLLRNSTMLAWGVNTFGQITPPSNLVNIVEISAGAYHNLARLADGRVVAWGRDDSFQSTVPSLPTNIIALTAGGYHSLALKSDGTVIGWGKGSQSFPPPGGGTLTDIAAGANHSLGIMTNSTLIGWGTNDLGQARPPNGLSNVIAIAAGDHHSVALRNDGTVVAWGANNLQQTNVPPDLSNVIAIACGANHSLALKADRTVVAWGHNNYGQIEVPTNLTGVVAIAGGGDRSLALTRKLLRLHSPLLTGEGTVRVGVGPTDGSTLTAERASKVQINVTTNLGLPPANWTKLVEGLSLIANVWRFHDSTNHPRRFYIAVEQP